MSYMYLSVRRESAVKRFALIRRAPRRTEGSSGRRLDRTEKEESWVSTPSLTRTGTSRPRCC
jgi:hypothetical protein